MTKRQELIYRKVKELSVKSIENNEIPGVTAQEISELLEMNRGNVSKEMNLLVSDQKLVKQDGRPVRFAETEAYEQYMRKADQKELGYEEDKENKKEKQHIFSTIIGGEKSLKKQVNQVKAAMLYPPHGLHTLLHGPTGTGKTMFAQKMYEYAKEMKMLEYDAQFVVFNCAEYAENSQLIVSQIFGHKKGAFTGADKDKPGLIEQADGGILFLDEIHRLPPEGQEMLFGLMDHGKYRRLGETERNRVADVLIIGATTEDLDKVLLKTFIRRMPVVIALPALEVRPLLERLELLEMFLTEEQKKISVSIKISKDAVLSMLLYDCSGNIGQMKSDIQLLCARGFWEYKAGERQTMELDRKLLPFYIEKGLYKAAESTDDLIRFLLNGDESYVFPAIEKGREIKQSVISKKYIIFHKFDSQKSEIDMHNGIQTYISSLLEKEGEERNLFNQDTLNKVVTGKVYYAVEEAIEFAEMRLKRSLSDNIKVGFAMHINALVEGIEKKKGIREDKLEQIVQNHPKEMKVARLILRILEDELGIHITNSEIGYITMFLCVDSEYTEAKTIGTIVLTHGQYTATSIADAVNRLLETQHCKAINMPLNEKVEAIYEKTLKIVKEEDKGRGVLLLVDMGSLNMFAERIEEETGIKVRSVGMVSTLMVLEAVRKCTGRDMELEEIVQYLQYMTIHMLEEDKRKRDLNKIIRGAILITCMSGMGAARKIAEMVGAITGLDGDSAIQTVCVGMDGMSEEGEYLGGFQESEILAVVGTADLHLNTAPYISVDEIVAGSGIEKIEQVINGVKSGAVIPRKKEIDKHILTVTLKELLDFLDAEKIVSLTQKIFDEYMKMVPMEQDGELTIRFFVHVGCMIERLLCNEPLPYEGVEEFKEMNKMEFQVLTHSFERIENIFSLSVPDTEKAYIVELLRGKYK